MRFASPLFVPELTSFLERLEQKGFTLTGGLQPPTPPNSFSASYEISDQIATKDNIIVDFDNSKQILGVQVMKTDQVVELFSEVKDLFLTDNQGLKGRIWFYELQASYRFHSKGSALRQISRSAEEAKLVNDASEIFGRKVGARGIFMSSVNIEPNTENYFDLNIISDINNSSLYDIIIIYRDESEDSVYSVAKSLSSKVKSFISSIEEL